MSAQKRWATPPLLEIDTKKKYQATLSTDKGDIVIDLFADKVPNTVNNFVFLARQGYYDGTIFHRVIADFMAQGGDPTGTGMGGPGYQFDNENAEAVFDRAGLVAMANSGANTNGSQFFITYDAAPDLNGGYTIFGEVLEGMDIVESLTARDPASGAELPEADRIISVKVTEK